MMCTWQQRFGFGVMTAVVGLALCASGAVKKPTGRAVLDSRVSDPYLGAIVMDAATGQVLFDDKADVQGYPASVIKLMDMMVILERIGSGQLRTNDLVTATEEAKAMGGSQVHLDIGETFSVEELLSALMIQSANDAAVALAIHVAGSKDAFVELMNREAAALGMTHTRFHSVHGLPPASGQEADVSTARDLAVLARELIRRTEILKYTSARTGSFRNGTLPLRNHNPLLGAYQGCDGLKTGWITAGGYSIVTTAERGGRRVIAAVIGSRDRKVRDAKVAELMTKGFAALPPLPPPAPVLPVVATNMMVMGPVGEIEDGAAEGGGWLKPAAAGLLGGLAVAGIVAWVMKRSSRRSL